MVELRAMVRGFRILRLALKTARLPTMSVDESFNSRRDKITRRRADQLRSPLRAAPVFGAPMFARRALDHPVRQRHPGLIGKNNVVLDGNVLHRIVRSRRRRGGTVSLQGLTAA